MSRKKLESLSGKLVKKVNSFVFLSPIYQIRKNTFYPEVTSCTGTYTNRKHVIGSSGRFIILQFCVILIEAALHIISKLAV